MKKQKSENQSAAYRMLRNIVGRTFALAMALSLGGAMANASAADTDSLPGLAAQPVEYFYTGKPYDTDSGSYTFKYRNYDPELNRWTSADPSGFPDGMNNQIYAPTPFSQFDWMGLQSVPITEYYELTLTNTFGWGHIAGWGATGATAGGAAGGAAGAYLTPPAWALALIGATIGGAAAISAGANQAYTDFQNSTNMAYPAGGQGTAGQITSTDSENIDDPILLSTNSLYTGNIFSWSWTMSGIEFTAVVTSETQYTYE